MAARLFVLAAFQCYRATSLEIALFLILCVFIIQKVIKRLRRQSVGALKCVNIDIRCRNIGVPEP